MNDHAGRRDAAYEATLAAIDDATERRCSHCHSPLPADSASEWWCSPSCQRAWGQQHTDNPRDVLEREDAAMVYVGRDAARVPLREPGERGWFRSAVDAAIPDVLAELEASVQEALDRSHAADVMRSGGPDVERTQGTVFEPRGVSPIEQAARQLGAVGASIGEFLGIPVYVDPDLPDGIQLRYREERGIGVRAAYPVIRAEDHHHTHCQHEEQCCRCRGRDECSQIRIRPGPYDSWADLRAAWSRLTNSGGTP